jgi:hypothetical protein
VAELAGMDDCKEEKKNIPTRILVSHEAAHFTLIWDTSDGFLNVVLIVFERIVRTRRGYRNPKRQTGSTRHTGFKTKISFCGFKNQIGRKTERDTSGEEVERDR